MEAMQYFGHTHLLFCENVPEQSLDQIRSLEFVSVDVMANAKLVCCYISKCFIFNDEEIAIVELNVEKGFNKKK